MPDQNTTRRMFEEMDTVTKSVATNPNNPRWLPYFGLGIRLWVNFVVIFLFVYVMYLNVRSYQSSENSDQLRQQLAAETGKSYEPVSPIRPNMIYSMLVTAMIAGWVTYGNRNAWRLHPDQKDGEKSRD